MADAGLNADVLLDIKKALSAVDKLEQALARATSGVIVTADARAVTAAIDAAVRNADRAVQVVGDASELTGEVTASVDAGDSFVDVTGDASELTGEVTAGVDAGDSNVTVTGDASELTGEVTAAVDAGDSQVSVTADTTQAQASIGRLGDEADQAAGGASRLQQALAGIGAAAIAKGLYDIASAASDLFESTSKASAVFGEGFGDIEKFSEGAAAAIGLSKQEALEATGTFGNLFQALGTSQEAAGELSPKIVTLAADLASFNNLPIDVALEKLRSGLVGEIEPLRGIGISFNAAQVEAKAFELGLAGAGDTVSEGAKLQARYALIVEQSSIANGDFARTSEGLANQQRILGAEFKNAVAAAGEQLLPTLLDLVAVARTDLIPRFSELADEVLPALGSVFSDLAPLLGITLDLLIALAPVIQVVADAIGAIPPGAIAAAAGVLLFSKAMTLLSTTAIGVKAALAVFPSLVAGTSQLLPGAASSAGLLGGGILKLGTALAGTNPLLLAAGGAAIFAYTQWNEAKDRARDVAAEVDKLGGILEGVGTEFGNTGAAVLSWVEGLISADSEIESTNEFLDRLSLKPEKVFGELGLSAERAANLISQGRDAVDEYVSGLGDLDNEGKIAAAALRELADQSEEAAQATLLAKDAAGELTKQQQEWLVAALASNAPASEFARILDEVGEAERRAAQAAEVATAKFGPAADAWIKGADALAGLKDTAPAVAAAILGIRDQGTDPTNESLIAFAATLGSAELTEGQMADAALSLGTDLETLTAFVEDTNEAVKAFVDTAVGGLPSISDAFNDANKDSKVSAQEFIDGLAEDTEKMTAFIEDLKTIVRLGFTDVAGELATQGVDVAGVVAEQLAGAQNEGNIALLEGTQAGLDERELAVSESTAFYRETLGPEFVKAVGDISTDANNAFAGFDPATATLIQMELSQLNMTTEGRQLAAIAATQGEAAARRYGAGLGLDQETIDEAVKAGLAIQRQSTTPFYLWGLDGGEQIAAGWVAGLTSNPTLFFQGGWQMANETKKGADSVTVPGSPSKTFRKMGEQVGAGFVLGIEDSTPAVAAAAVAMATSAIAAVTSVTASSITVGVEPEVRPLRAGDVPPVDVQVDAVLAPFAPAQVDVTAILAPFEIPPHEMQVAPVVEAFDVAPHEVQVDPVLAPFVVPDAQVQIDPVLGAFDVAPHEVQVDPVLAPFEVPPVEVQVDPVLGAFEIPPVEVQVDPVLGAFEVPPVEVQVDAILAPFEIPPVEVQVDAALGRLDPVVVTAQADLGQSSEGDTTTTITFASGSVVIQPPPGMTPDQARTVGSAVVDGIERRLQERALSVSARTI